MSAEFGKLGVFTKHNSVSLDAREQSKIVVRSLRLIGTVSQAIHTSIYRAKVGLGLGLGPNTMPLYKTIVLIASEPSVKRSTSPTAYAQSHDSKAFVAVLVSKFSHSTLRGLSAMLSQLVAFNKVGGSSICVSLFYVRFVPVSGVSVVRLDWGQTRSTAVS